MELLREAQPLHGGYWIPTPYRTVEIGEEFGFIGAMPTAHDLLGNIRMEGLCRFVTPDVAERFPRQSLENWMGVTYRDASVVVDKFITTHFGTETGTTKLTGVEYLKLAPLGAKGYCQFQWSEEVVNVLPAENIAICKQVYNGRIRYFSASLRKGSIATEAPVYTGVPRLLFAIARHVGTPIRVSAFPSSRGVEVTVSERLPVEEFRLALLTSREAFRAGRSTRFTFSPKLASVFCAQLALLGCSLEAQQ